MFNPNDQVLLPLVAVRSTFVPSESVGTSALTRSTKSRTSAASPSQRRPADPGLTKLPIGYSPS